VDTTATISQGATVNSTAKIIWLTFINKFWGEFMNPTLLQMCITVHGEAGSKYKRIITQFIITYLWIIIIYSHSDCTVSTKSFIQLDSEHLHPQSSQSIFL